ncbi:MAG TPA: peptidase T [Ferruginibacter sp.]|nr:peptidase T [Ferruginibacter sp.]HRO16626.1 peptidase T [Ferruginibacter sp.]HRQ21708.1 peptidase T [Ferruginibacter sp.]
MQKAEKMIHIQPDDVAARFMRYVQVDTQSDPNATSFPSTEKQKDLSRILEKELKEMGMEDVEMDENGYVYAKLSSNVSHPVPVIAFCAHVDTAPDCSGTNVLPILHRNYDGVDIPLPKDPVQVLRLKDSPYLKNHIGKDIITASGDTLLGADDKSGVAAIMQAMQFLITHPDVKHGDVRVVFTPDEEVGRGTEKINLKKLGAQFGYTLDGGEAGCLEDETFSADGATITIHGVIAHPGYAKDKLVNAIKIAGAVLDALPKNEWSPETTEKKQGFVHPVAVNGIAEKATISFIVRDFQTPALQSHHQRLEKMAREVVSTFQGATMEYEAREQYRNMKDILVQNPQVVEYAAEAIRRAGLTVTTESIRGGTDGSRLSYMGLPCPNIFTGMQNIHSKLEWIGTADMAKAAETVVHLCAVWQERSIG